MQNLERELTRRERYELKKRSAKTFNVSLVAINFRCDGNLGFLIRAAACFGAKSVCVIGALPERRKLYKLSGSLSDSIEIKTFKTPSDFMSYVRSIKNAKLVAAEICDSSKSLWGYKFNKENHYFIAVGHEEFGVPGEMIFAADSVVHIPMPGIGFCLNTSQTANIMLHEYVKQMSA